MLTRSLVAMRVLVVEDNPDMGPYLKRGLMEHGFAVDLATDGNEGLAHAATGVYDLLILDRMLPGRDGLDILRHLRSDDVRTPAIFLTAKNAVDDRIVGLDSGADDYLIKPFSFAELLARIRVVLRRGPDNASAILRVGELSLDPATHAVERSGKRIELSAKQFVLLHYLMRHAGQVVSRTMIQEHVWNYEFDGLTNVVDVHINRLRNKVDRGFDRSLIHTLRGVGYVLRDA
jgi:heavy metal response regulator